MRRSGARESEAKSHPLRSPYRCADCGARFWVLSRRARIAAMLVAASVIPATLLAVVTLLAMRPSTAPRGGEGTATSTLDRHMTPLGPFVDGGHTGAASAPQVR